jgi:hypothetical protein
MGAQGVKLPEAPGFLEILLAINHVSQEVILTTFLSLSLG